ncbi:MAG: four helix bundle protein [Candidatus Peregrinibacteria bacterium]|nr:four helix bundle protein [Candidatus Peregrinibacteria bacterium]
MIKLPYKKLQIWQKSMLLTQQVYKDSQVFPKEEMYGLTSQIRRSAISVPSNIAEGSQRRSDKEFASFILIAKGSLAELETQLLLAETFSYLNNEKLSVLLEMIDELDRMLFAFGKKLTANRSPLTASNGNR